MGAWMRILLGRDDSIPLDMIDWSRAQQTGVIGEDPFFQTDQTLYYHNRVCKKGFPFPFKDGTYHIKDSRIAAYLREGLIVPLRVRTLILHGPFNWASEQIDDRDGALHSYIEWAIYRESHMFTSMIHFHGERQYNYIKHLIIFGFVP